MPGEEERSPKRRKTAIASCLQPHRECFRVEVPWLSVPLSSSAKTAGSRDRSQSRQTTSGQSPRGELGEDDSRVSLRPEGKLEGEEEESQALRCPEGKLEGEDDSGRTLTITVLSDPRNEHDLGVAALLWPASRLLSEVLLRPFVLGPDWAQLFEQKKALSVLELGAGTALPSLCLAALGHSVHATDLAEALPVTRANADANSALYSQLGASPPVVRALEFGDVEAAKALPAFDVVLASDVAYEPRTYYPLLETLKSLRGTTWRALLAISQRVEDLGEETFENTCQDEQIPLRLKYTALVGNVRPRRVNIYELKASDVKLGEA